MKLLAPVYLQLYFLCIVSVGLNASAMFPIRRPEKPSCMRQTNFLRTPFSLRLAPPMHTVSAQSSVF